MAGAAPFRHVAVLGTGLVGGSFALALRRSFPSIERTGWDRPDVLTRAIARDAITRASEDLADAVAGADLIYLALPVGAALDLLPTVAAHADASALITDACSTKVAIVHRANKLIPGPLRFLGGHPMVGKEAGGIENADAELFRGAPYVLIGAGDEDDPRPTAFVELLHAMGAHPVWYDAETHDWAVGIVSHLPQLVSVALARVVLDETDETGLPVSLAGPGLRDALRLAGSPYLVWRDICLTNRENVARALDRVAQTLDGLRTRLTSRELEDEFRAANELYKMLCELK